MNNLRDMKMRCAFFIVFLIAFIIIILITTTPTLAMDKTYAKNLVQASDCYLEVLNITPVGTLVYGVELDLPIGNLWNGNIYINEIYSITYQRLLYKKPVVIFGGEVWCK